MIVDNITNMCIINIIIVNIINMFLLLNMHIMLYNWYIDSKLLLLLLW